VIPEFDSLIQQIRSSYNKADLLLRLPFYGDMSAFSKITDIPLVARKTELPKERVLQLLKIAPGKRDKLILLAFRATDLKEVDFDKIESMQGFKFVTLRLAKSYKNCINIPANFIRFPNLLNGRALLPHRRVHI